ncbi:MAG: hypothetical protein ABJQ70_09840 [Roseobacter sp.]
MQISNYREIIELAGDTQLSCPIYQQALLSYWTDRSSNRRTQRDQVCDFYRDHTEMLFVPPIPQIDDIIRDEHATVLRRLNEGAHIRNVPLIRMLDGMVRVQAPNFIKFARLHAHNKKLSGR